MVRGRGSSTPEDEKNKKIIANNINRLLKEKNVKQVDLRKGTGIPASTITGYVKGTSLPNAGNVQKMADFFSVKKSEIDPRFDYELADNKSIDANLTRLTNNYQKLNKKDKQKLVDYSDELVDERYLKLVRENAAANDGKLHNQRTEKSEKAKARFLKETGLIDENNI